MYKLDININTDSAFLINRSLIENRLEPKFYTKKYIDNQIKIEKSKLPVFNLSEVTKIISDGTHFKPVYVSDGVKFISVKDVRKSKIDFNKTKFISEEEADKLDKRCKPKKADVLLTKIGATFGYASTVETDERFQIFVSLALLRPNEKVLSKYLEIFLNSDLAYTQYERVVKGAGVPDLHLEDIRKIKMPLPSIAKQQQIVSIYNIALNEKQQKEKEAKKLMKSIDVFLLNELGISSSVRDTSLKNRFFRVNFSELSSGRFDVFSFYNKGIKIEGGAFVNKRLFEIASLTKGQSITSKKVVKGNFPVIAGGKSTPYSHNIYNYKDETITVSASGAYAGYIWYHNYPIFASDCSVIKCKDENVVSMKYLSEILKLKQKEIYGLQQGAGQPHVYSSDLGKLNIPLPNLEIQNKITNCIDEIRERANKLKLEAICVLKEVNIKIEKMILG